MNLIYLPKDNAAVMMGSKRPVLNSESSYSTEVESSRNGSVRNGSIPTSPIATDFARGPRPDSFPQKPTFIAPPSVELEKKVEKVSDVKSPILAPKSPSLAKSPSPRKSQADIHREMTQESQAKTAQELLEGDLDEEVDETDLGSIVKVIENSDTRWGVSVKVAKIFIEQPESIKVKVSKKTITIKSQIEHDSRVSYLKV